MTSILKTLAMLAAFSLASTGVALTAGTGERISQICGECAVEKWASCGPGKFLEGPNFDAAGNMWLVGVQSGEILKVSPAGACTVAKGGINGPNGTRFNKQDRLIVAARDGLLSFDTRSGEIGKLVSTYDNQAFRGLNDVVIDRLDGIYFTEPYGSDAHRPNGRVFYLPAGDKAAVRLIADNFAFPNGLALSGDETVLYVAETSFNRTMALQVSNGTRPASAAPNVFAYYQGGVGPDGMLIDTDGNIYVAHYGAGEVVVHDRGGIFVGRIKLPADAGLSATNIAISGGYLYVTEAAKNEIYRVRITKALPN